MAAEVSHRSTFINIPEDALRDLINMRLSVPKIAKLLGVSIKTVRRRMSTAGLSVRATYAELTEEQLDHVVASVVVANPNLGARLIKAMLWSQHGIRVADQRLRNCIARIDPVGLAQRRSTNRAINRRVFTAPYSMWVWSADTYLKLSRYNVVVRGALDAKSRLCVYLQAGTNNKAISSLESFLGGVQQYNVPSHCRTDKGTETVLIARFMLVARGLQGHWTGKSTRNQRIERYWRDVRRTTGYFCDTFLELEWSGLLNIDDPTVMAVFHWVFIPRLNDALAKFREAWNEHPLSTEGNRTPNQLFLLHYRSPEQQERQYTWHEIERMVAHVMQYAPDQEPSDNVRYLQDPPSGLTEEQQRQLSTIDVLRDSYVNGKDVYIECLETLGLLHAQ